MEAFSKEFSVVFKQVIAWGDMDAFQHVNNARYYRYIESARIQYMVDMGMFDNDVMSVVSHNSCQYLYPVTYPDTLHIGVNVVEMRNSSFSMSYTLYSEKQQRVVTKASAVVVAMQADGLSKRPLPQVIRENILALEARAGRDVKQLTK